MFVKNIKEFLLIAITLSTFSCKQTVDEQSSSLPTDLVFTIPKALADGEAVEEDFGGTFAISYYYQLARVYLQKGHDISTFLDDITQGLQQKKINGTLEESFRGDDGRSKLLVVEEGVEIGADFYDFKLTIKDIEDGLDTALQVYWNRYKEDRKVIFHPFMLDQRDYRDYVNLRYELNYQEASDTSLEIFKTTDGYDAWGIKDLHLQFIRNNQGVYVKAGLVSNNISLIEDDAIFSDTSYRYTFLYRGVYQTSNSMSKIQFFLIEDSMNTVNEIRIDSSIIDSVLKREFYNRVDTLSVLDSVKDHRKELLQTYLDAGGNPFYFNNNGFYGAGSSVDSDHSIDLSTIELSEFLDVKTLSIHFE